MTFKFLKIIGIGFILSVSTLSNATLIDNGDYTTDTESGLDWLDWSETLGDTQAEALAEFSGDGWRIATSMEATDLIESYFGISLPGTFGKVRTTNRSDPTFIPDVDIIANQFLSFFGTYEPWGASLATISGAGLFGVDKIYHLYTGHGTEDYGQVDYRYRAIGVALVKASTVSEPAIITIFALGFAGIGLARRRRQS
jgi:hypothetical protein